LRIGNAPKELRRIDTATPKGHRLGTLAVHADALVAKDARAVCIETPGNPRCDVPDIIADLDQAINR
jgi:hypothetical protein